jgi:transcription initiation factor IIE alpha subunit
VATSISLGSNVVSIARKIHAGEPIVDDALSAELGITHESVRLSLERLAEYGAISFEHLRRVPKAQQTARVITVHPDSWVWSAISSAGAEQ